MKTYTIEDADNSTAAVIKIYNDLNSDDGTSLIAFFVFIFALILLGLFVYYGSLVRLGCNRVLFWPLRRLCCDGQRRKVWAAHKAAVIRADAAEAHLLGGDTYDTAFEAWDAAVAPRAPTHVDADDPLERQLAGLVGLEPLKEEIRALRRMLVVEEQRRTLLGGLKGSKAAAPHMIFRGAPGTGKTHAARLIARLLLELGYVQGGLVEVQRADLVSGYVGQTALKTRAVINRAKGGVLFVDEAYSLTPHLDDGGRDFGGEAVQEIMRDLTAGDPVVILAGYPDLMQKFLKVNPGLSRRFQVRFTFEDYSFAELALIFLKIAARNGFALARDVTASGALEGVLRAHFSQALCRTWNGGLPEGLFRRAQDALAKRLNVLTMSAELASTLTIDDVRNGARILASTLGDPSARPNGAAGRAPASAAVAAATAAAAAAAAAAPPGAPQRQAATAPPGAPQPAAAKPAGDDLYNDDDTGIYAADDDEAPGETTNPLAALLASLGGGASAFGALAALPARLAAIEASLAALAPQPTNPWAAVPSEDPSPV
ncbi:P-loop containing nucleoside triphosphate hydrolase protein [Pelagophyceae sp. CCMP2097]|nr:P-loop containing nucleoside triphosphate hydrolase protein [Pelagophyceae sp. CCMP2097]